MKEALWPLKSDELTCLKYGSALSAASYSVPLEFILMFKKSKNQENWIGTVQSLISKLGLRMELQMGGKREV